MNRPDATGVVHTMLLADDADPRVWHTGFALLFALDLTLRFSAGDGFRWPSWPLAGALLTVVMLGAAWLAPWDRLPPVAVAAVPLLEIAALGMSRLSADVGGAGILLVMPALWLGRQFGRRGALVTAVASTLLLALPGLVYLGLTGPNLSRSLLVPLVGGLAALAIASGLERIRAGRDEAERRGVELAAALETIEHQRRVAEAVLDTVDVGLVLLDGTGAYESMNRRHREFMRLAFPDGHLGRAGQLGAIYAADGTTALGRDAMPTLRASRGEEFDDCRIWVGTDPLTRRALSVSARIVRDDNQAFVGAALAYTDVTDFMRALRVKDEFVASVSHELRTPLTSIVGYVNLLLEREDLPQDSMTHLEVVARNSDRLRRLIADLLHTAQADEGPMNVARARSDLSQIVRDSVQAAAPAAQLAEVRLEVDLPDALPILVDPQRMAQVVDNLVSNAIKYTPAGGRVDVRLRLDANRVELAVRDTGIGISAADKDRLFTRFFRARDSAERSVQGVGLGLSITKGIVESHGGRIEVESEVGWGSVFRVRLPLDVDHPVEVAAPGLV